MKSLSEKYNLVCEITGLLLPQDGERIVTCPTCTDKFVDKCRKRRCKVCIEESLSTVAIANNIK